MFMFALHFLLSLIKGENLNDYSHVAASIENLHSKTNFSTFYEMFGVKENAPIKIVKQGFIRLIKNRNPFPNLNLSKEEADKIITEGYNIIKDKRRMYDYLLEHNDIYGFIENKRDPFYSFMWIFTIIFSFVLLDFLYLIISFIIKCSKRTNKKDKKKDAKKEKNVMYSLNLQDLLIAKGFVALKKFIKK